MNIVTEIEVIKFLKEKITDSIEIPATIPFVQSGILNSLQLVNMVFELEKYFGVKFDLSNYETIIKGMGELHLAVYVERMKCEYKCEVIVGQPQFAFRCPTLFRRTPTP